MTDAGVEPRRIVIKLTEEDMVRQDLPSETLRVGGTLAGVFHMISARTDLARNSLLLTVTNYVLPVVPENERPPEYTLKEALALYWDLCQKEE